MCISHVYIYIDLPVLSFACSSCIFLLFQHASGFFARSSMGSSPGSDGIWSNALAAARAGPTLSMLSFNELVATCERMVPRKNGG